MFITEITALTDEPFGPLLAGVSRNDKSIGWVLCGRGDNVICIHILKNIHTVTSQQKADTSVHIYGFYWKATQQLCSSIASTITLAQYRNDSIKIQQSLVFTCSTLNYETFFRLIAKSMNMFQ